MSRRVNPAADRAAQNQQTIKALLKLEGNKVCADCKRNKHPRWASWNLGIFVCIRCSGIHRGMGTHISRVKSVDLDSWTDEQLQSVLKWGNSRANKYWEAKLAQGHVPSEAKIENFIRTKYESKRWVMDGPMPDPSTLDADGDDDVPLSLVQEKAKIERSSSQRIASAPQAQQPVIRQQAPNVDLFGDDTLAAPAIRPTTADIPDNKPTRVGVPPIAKPKAADSLLGFDFFGGQTTNTGRPSSAASNPLSSTSNSRSEMKQSILSLYSSAPKPQPPAQSPPLHGRQLSFGGMASAVPAQSDSFGGLTDAFGSLSFPSTTSVRSPPIQPTTNAFSGLGGFSSPMIVKATPSAPQVTSPPPLVGGSFFDAPLSKPTQSRVQAPSVPARAPPNALNFTFASTQVAPSTNVAPVRSVPTASSNDLFAADDFSGFTSASPAPPPAPPSTSVSSPAITNNTNFSSAFNLSSPITNMSKPAAPVMRSPVASPSSTSMFDPWASAPESNGWGASESVPVKASVASPSVKLGKIPSHITPNDISGSWGAPITSANNKSNQAPTVTADEDFGGWTSASTTQTPVDGPAKRGGGFTSAPDPFDNPWG